MARPAGGAEPGVGRHSQGALIYGLHAVESALRNDPVHVARVLVDRHRNDRRAHALLALAAGAGVAVERWTRQALNERSGGAAHQGVIAEYRAAPVQQEQALEDLVAGAGAQALLLVLDGVQDPHNLGACLRAADAAGAQAVVVPRDRAAGMSPVVRKVASGAADHLPLVRVANLARCLKDLQAQGVWLVGADGSAETALYDCDLRGPLALVLGGEGGGLRRLTRERCDLLARIPMAGRVESLNVAVAAGICLFEARRQRGA